MASVKWPSLDRSAWVDGSVSPGSSVCSGVTVKVALRALPALVVTVIRPVLAPPGTVAVIRRLLLTVADALTPPKATEVTCRKPLPARVTSQPGAPAAGTTEEILGGAALACSACWAGVAGRGAARAVRCRAGTTAGCWRCRPAGRWW